MLSYKECLAILADPAKNPAEVVNGLPIQIKNVPDAEVLGAADPRYKAHEEYKAAHPRVHDKPDLRTYNGIPVGAIRQSMGWPNEDISTRPIETQHLYLPVSEGAVPVRVYIPEEKGDTLRACMIYIHGGGFIGGSIDVVENPCKLLCDVADAVVFNVDYRLAPETAYPGGLHDCYDTVKYVYEHADQWGIEQFDVCSYKVNQLMYWPTTPADGEFVCRITEGPFKHFVGVIEDVNEGKNKLKVMVTVFDRAAPVEVDYLQVEKIN